jgi:hypothetical protein
VKRRVSRKATVRSCKVKWCVALAVGDSDRCAVHAIAETIHPVPWAVPTDKTLGPALMTCQVCEGSGDCPDCDGNGEHECEHANCYESHDCRTCRGRGTCPECHGSENDEAPGLWLVADVFPVADKASREVARAYLAFNLLPVWEDPSARWAREMYLGPWESAA